MADCLFSMARTPDALRGGGWKRDDEIEAGKGSYRTQKGDCAGGEGVLYGRTDDGLQMRRYLETVVGDGLGIGEMRLRLEEADLGKRALAAH
jgi:hypothetical protein